MTLRSLIYGAAGTALLATSSITSAQSLSLPTLEEFLLPGEAITVPVTGTLTGASSVTFSFNADMSLLAPDTVGGVSLIQSHLFEGGAGESAEWNIVGNEVIVAVAGSYGVDAATMTDGIVAELGFVVRDYVLTNQTIPLTFNTEGCSVDEEPLAGSTDGSVSLEMAFGDVTFNDLVSALDAAEILKYAVKKTTEIDFARGDVSGDGTVGSLDASLVLRRVVEPSFLFPVQTVTPPKAAIATARALTWVQDGSAWNLVVDDPSGVYAGTFTFDATAFSNITATGGFAETNRVGDEVLVAFARVDDASPVLLSVTADIAPTIASASLNDGLISVATAAQLTRPTEFVLAQNAPNPFNPTTTIQFALPQSGAVNLSIWTANGQLVRTLVSSDMAAGSHSITWDAMDSNGRAVASGTYLYRLTTNDNTQIRRMTLAR